MDVGIARLLTFQKFFFQWPFFSFLSGKEQEKIKTKENKLSHKIIATITFFKCDEKKKRPKIQKINNPLKLTLRQECGGRVGESRSK